MKIYPVVHVLNTGQTIEQAGLAFEHGADGIYVIDHHNVSPKNVLGVFDDVKREYPESFVGINFLQTESAAEDFELIRASLTNRTISCAPDALWKDDVRPRHRDNKAVRSHKLLKDIEYLGGIAFKYTTGYTDDPVTAIKQAKEFSKYTDTIITSGSGTGSAASLEKLRAMKAVATERDQQLAVASGVGIKNIESLQGIVDVVLVASSVEIKKGLGIFDNIKLRDLIQAAHKR